MSYTTRTVMIELNTEDSRVQKALWVRINSKLLGSLRLVQRWEGYPRKLVFGWGMGAGHIGGWTAHVRLERYSPAKRLSWHFKPAPWVGVTRNWNKWH